MPCDKFPKGLGEAIKNTGAKGRFGREVKVTGSSSVSPRGSAINSPKYKSGEIKQGVEIPWR